jgi:hypothetical protein
MFLNNVGGGTIFAGMLVSKSRGPTVGYFNFDIDTSAEFIHGAINPRSTRDLFKIAEVKRRWNGIAPNVITMAADSDRRTAPQNRASNSIRRHDIQQEVVNRSVIQVKKNSTYRNFKISATRLSHSVCVAYFERLDGRPIVWEGTARSIVKTESYCSETLAITDAQMSIDDLMASEPGTGAD